MTKRKRTYGSFSRKRRNTRRSRFIRWAKSASAQSRQIQTNNRRINSVNRRLRADTQKYGMYYEFTGSNYANEFICIAPARVADSTFSSTFPQWTNCFGNAPNAAEANRVRLGRCHLKMQFTSYTERDPVTYSVFHVRLNPKNAQYVTQTWGPTLTASSGTPRLWVRGANTLTQGLADGAASTMLNPDYFIVKKSWHFTLAQYVSTNDTGQPQRSAQNTGSGTLKNISYSFPMNYTLGKGINNWTEVSAHDDTDPSLRNYLLIFTNNQLADLQSNSYSILAQVTASYKA